MEDQVPKGIHRRPDANPQKGLKKYGKATFADPVNKKYPIDTPGRIKAAWAYIHQPLNAGKYTDEEVRTIKIRVRELRGGGARAGGGSESSHGQVRQDAARPVCRDPALGRDEYGDREHAKRPELNSSARSG